MGNLNAMEDPQISELRDRFEVAMRRARQLFGVYAFRKRTSLDGRRQPINKALFEAWSVNLEALDASELTRLEARKEQLTSKFIKLMNEPPFHDAVSQGTGDVKKVQLRFREIKQIIRESLDDEALAH
jgi:hypothetical protein